MAGHTPYGYKIVDARAVIDEPAAEKLRQLYLEFVECGSMRAAATKVGIEKTHSVIGRLLNKELYTGTDYYPAIIDKELFDKAQERRKNNARSQNRIRPYEIKEPEPEPVNFHLKKVSTKFDDPYKQAEYAYGLIEEEFDE
ncbi:MAG: hypothetical protein Q4D29_01255 [Lachnospiraceae bacterium]|nr:hypothetical protein [Lachnospiraceae bacterium]